MKHGEFSIIKPYTFVSQMGIRNVGEASFFVQLTEVSTDTDLAIQTCSETARQYSHYIIILPLGHSSSLKLG